jgi:hypothetical protein
MPAAMQIPGRTANPYVQRIPLRRISRLREFTAKSVCFSAAFPQEGQIESGANIPKKAAAPRLIRVDRLQTRQLSPEGWRVVKSDLSPARLAAFSFRVSESLEFPLAALDAIVGREVGLPVLRNTKCSVITHCKSS